MVKEKMWKKREKIIINSKYLLSAYMFSISYI